MNLLKLANDFVDIAKEYVGTTEQPVGSNRGALIDKWNKLSNVAVGSFWCCSFVSAMARELAEKHDIVWPFPYTADCDVIFAVAKKKNAVVHIPEPGDLFVCHKGNDAYHIGIVEDVDNTYIATSIEGNSNNDGSRNGITVARREDLMAGRSINTVSYIRWTSLVTLEDDWKLVVSAKEVECINHNNRVYAPLRMALGLFFTSHDVLVNLKATNEGAAWGDEMIPAQLITRDGSRYISVRDLSSWLGKTLVVNSIKKTVSILKS